MTGPKTPRPRRFGSRILRLKPAAETPPAQSVLPLWRSPPTPPLKCNVFFALSPDAAAQAQCADVVHRLRGQRIAVGKPLEAERLHVSLCNIGTFFDQIPRAHLPTACNAAASVRMAPFRVTFDLLRSTTGHMILCPSGDLPELHAFHEKLKDALARAGMRRWLTWDFNPHVTLSYGACTPQERPVEPVSWIVHDFVLIESLYGRHRHIARGRWRIEPSDPSTTPGNQSADAGRDVASGNRLDT